MTTPVTLADAAEELGVHYMTAYRYVRTGRMAAEKRGGKWWVDPADLAAVAAEGTGRRESAAGANRENLLAPFKARLLVGDTAGCWNLISDALAAGATPAEVHGRLLRTALVEIGEGWQRGELTVSDEHRATAAAVRLLGQLGPLFRHRGRRRGTIVVGAAAGDTHALPTAMLSDLLCDRRFDVIDLGANAPTASFVDASAIDDLVGVGVCTVLDELVPSTLEQIGELRRALPGTFLLAGGPALVPRAEQCRRAGADVVSADATEACAAFERVVDPPKSSVNE